MANSLLDFVISLVRDPQAAARYAANPAQAIAEAHLANVTSADVNGLIPVVSDSLSMAGPAGGASGAQAADHGNVWASGAAAAALDAFSPHVTASAVPHHGPGSGVITEAAWSRPRDLPADPQLPGPSVLFTNTETPDPVFDDGGFPAHDPAMSDPPVSHPAEPDHHGFDIHG
ncbi:hypothetical protein F0Q45_13165 [Mycobacterium simiae]|uniref:Uncharacterized protein n=1 Tax=Mycobacterium simiae TaxID=1784 RepID=A0A5B1BRX6_MYCSI|nr:IniB N-terminal domain-containing protein [Mycobacterium simiae]KAA1249819.1 hypothetical protein F0Q45_13165 [Mycobacterium simiae]